MMQPLSICAPLRPAVVGGRVSTATLGYSSCPKPSFQKQPTRLASTSLSRTIETKTPFSAPVLLQMCSRPHASPTVMPSASRITHRVNSTSSSANAGPDDSKLTWDSFFKLRATRRRYSVASSILTSAATTVLGVQYISTQDIESLGAQVMGLDPFVVLGMATMACGAAGWLLGPFVGNGVWSLVNRKYTSAFARKEKEFFDRIRRFRVDPSANSIANPVPDYYGEKIGSVQGYRQWLKDQRAYNRKKRSFIL